jgi:hypothetical protein
MMVARIAGAERLEQIGNMRTLEQELQKIYDAGLGVSITWLCD